MGGGGGGDGGATARQQQIEAQKTAARERLNTLFGASEGSDEAAQNRAARDELYSTVRTNAFDAGKRSLDEDYQKAQRQNKFALFAQGLNAGSEDINQNALLGRTYDQGLLDLGAKADAAKAGFKANDESSRLQLLQSIDAGMDQSSAISSAMNQMKNNYDRQLADANTTELNDLFSTSGALYTQSQAAKGKQAGITDWWNQLNQLGGANTKNKAAATGIQTSTYG